MAEYFVAGYNFESAMNNTAIHAKIRSGVLESISQKYVCKLADFCHAISAKHVTTQLANVTSNQSLERS
jgi:hypothetical protein